MAEVTITLSDEEQAGLLSLVDAALRSSGRNALAAAVHWEQKLAQARRTENGNANINDPVRNDAQG